MTIEELEIRKFELAQKIQSEELELKKKELDLKIQEQKSKRIFTPLIISIVGGLITIITGIVLKYFDSRTTLDLEDRKFQSSLLLKATEAKNYEEFSDMLVAFQDNGMLSLDSVKIARFKKKRFIATQQEKAGSDTSLYANNYDLKSGKSKYTTLLPSPPFEDNLPAAPIPAKKKKSKNPSIMDSVIKNHPVGPNSTKNYFYWTIVAGGAANLIGAKTITEQSKKIGFNEVNIWYRNESYRTCIGKYSTYSEAINGLFDVKEKVNNSSYIVRFDKWCINSTYDPVSKIYICN